jgi:hypothetical protein
MRRWGSIIEYASLLYMWRERLGMHEGGFVRLRLQETRDLLVRLHWRAVSKLGIGILFRCPVTLSLGDMKGGRGVILVSKRRMLSRVVVKTAWLLGIRNDMLSRCMRSSGLTARYRNLGLKQRQQCASFVLLGGWLARYLLLQPLGRRLHLKQPLQLSSRTLEGIKIRSALSSLGPRPGIIFNGSLLRNRFGYSIYLVPGPAGVPLLLLDNPLLEGDKERRNHVKLVCVGSGVSAVAVVSVALLPECRELRQLVPLDLTNFLPGTRLEASVHGYIAEDVEANLLITHSNLDEFGLLLRSD